LLDSLLQEIIVKTFWKCQRMSKATKRKHVTREVTEDFRLPDENESVVRVVAGRGNNLHEVKDQHGELFLVSMPTKFRKSVWIKRGDFVIVSHIKEGDKVKGEITTVLYKDQIKYLKSEGVWPKEFDAVQPLLELENLKLGGKESEIRDSDSQDDDDDEDIFKNTNRPVCDTSSEDSSSEEGE